MRVQGPDRFALARRDFLICSAVLGAVVAWPLRSATAADFHRFTHGAFDITVLSDGYLTLPAEILLPDAMPPEQEQILRRLRGDRTGAPVAANIPLIRHGSDLILIDNGAGINFQASAGRLAANLRTLGISPEAITKVVFTHLHPDHSGATTTPEGKALYPNAEYFVGDREFTFWTDKDYEAHMPPALHDFARGAQRDLASVRTRLTIVKPGDEIVPGMHVVSTPGHTPGHISIELAGDGNLLVTGDACTSDVIFFEHPAWHFGFDTDQDLALRNRQALLDRAATERFKMLGYHWAYPGIGYAERKGTSYRFVKGS